MDFVRSVAWVLGFWFLGESISQGFHLPVPGSVLGLLLLYICLRRGWVKTEWVALGARGLLSILALLFVPAGAGVAAYLSPAWWGILGVILILTPLLVGLTGAVVQRLVRE
jgi:holin-like protein